MNPPMNEKGKANCSKNQLLQNLQQFKVKE
jgi:hypothetical protein